MDLFDIFYCCFASDSAPVPLYHSSGPGDYGTSMKFPMYYPSDDYHHDLLSNDPSNNPQFRYVDHVSAVVATAASDFEAPPPSRHRGYPEGSGLTSSHSQPRHPVDDGDALPTEGSRTFTQSSPTHLRADELHLPSLPQTPLIPIPELNLNTDIPCGLTPLQYDHPSTATWDISSNEYGEFSASIGSKRDNRTPLGTRSIPSTSFGQTSVTTHSRPSRNRGSIGSFAGAGHGYRSTPPNFGSASRRRHHTVAVPPIASGKVSTPRRIREKYRCEECDAGFTQRQGLRRHSKDVHGPRRLCPRCNDFEWSPGRKYTLKKHFEAVHPGAALPEFLQRQDTGDPLQTLA